MTHRNLSYRCAPYRRVYPCNGSTYLDDVPKIYDKTIV